MKRRRFLISAAVLAGLLAAGPSASQPVTPHQPVTDEWCAQAQLQGLWQVSILGFSCTIRLSATGAISPVGTCAGNTASWYLPDGVRGGPLAIDKFCRMTGPINVRRCEIDLSSGATFCTTFSFGVEAFSSADRTHIVGYGRYTPGSGSITPLDFIYRLK